MTPDGVFTWTPSEAHGPGSYPVTVIVTDGVSSAFETITITVAEVNAAPVLGAIGDKTVDELSELTFTASSIDADLPANTLTYSLGASAPAGAAIDSATGVFSWTPTEAQGPGTYSITVTVSDGTASDSEAITITVAEVADEQPPANTYNPPVTSSGGSSPEEQDSDATADEDAESDPATETDAPAEDTDDGDAEAEDADEAAAADEPEADAPADDESGFPWWMLAVAGALAGVGLAGWAIRGRNAGSGA